MTIISGDGPAGSLSSDTKDRGRPRPAARHNSIFKHALERREEGDGRDEADESADANDGGLVKAGPAIATLDDRSKDDSTDPGHQVDDEQATGQASKTKPPGNPKGPRLSSGADNWRPCLGLKLTEARPNSSPR